MNQINPTKQAIQIRIIGQSSPISNPINPNTNTNANPSADKHHLQHTMQGLNIELNMLPTVHISIIM